jgi:hypothetical protein
VRHGAAPETGRLLRVLLLWLGAVPTGPARARGEIENFIRMKGSFLKKRTKKLLPVFLEWQCHRHCHGRKKSFFASFSEIKRRIFFP